jgi:hypothetical protein
MNKIPEIPNHFPMQGRIIGYVPHLAYVEEETGTVYLQITEEKKLNQLKEDYPDFFKGKLKKGEYDVVANENNPLLFIILRMSENRYFVNTQFLLQELEKDNDEEEKEDLLKVIDFFLELCKKHPRR